MGATIIFRYPKESSCTQHVHYVYIWPMSNSNFTKSVNVRLTDVAFTRLRELAMSQDLKVADLVRAAIREHFEIPASNQPAPTPTNP